MTLVITTEIKVDYQEITLNTLLNNNYLDLKPQEEDINNSSDNKNNIIDPVKIKNQKRIRHIKLLIKNKYLN